jgi:predicted deacylase
MEVFLSLESRAEVVSVRAEAFAPQSFSRGGKYAFDLIPGGAARDIPIPVLLVRGASAGRTLVATAGIHGDEYEGVQALFEVNEALDPRAMRGDFLAVPVANPPAFWSGTRTSPLDRGNLARAFPGDSAGGPTAALAYHLARSVIAHADFYVDLHSSGVRLLMPTMAGYDARDRQSRAAALAFGASVIWGHPTIAPGRTISFAAERGIPWLYTEARGGGRVDPFDLRVFVNGLTNLLRHLEILEGQPSGPAVQVHLYGDGNLDEGLCATRAGFFLPEVGLLESVAAGQHIGKLFNLHGATIETYMAPAAGIMAMLRTFPVVERGDPLFLITGLGPVTQ